MFSESFCSYCLAVKWESLWRGRHCKMANFWSHDRSTANRNALSLWNDLWLVKICRHGLDFSKAWKQSHEEEQKSSFLSDHLNCNMLKGYYGFFAKLCQKIVAYCHFNEHRQTLAVFVFSVAASDVWMKKYCIESLIYIKDCKTLSQRFLNSPKN